MDNRGTSAVVGKLLGAGLVLLYVSGATTVMLGDVVPGAERATGRELAERVLGDAAGRLERALAPAPGRLDGRLEVALPATIAGAGYSLRLDGRTLELNHPDPGLSIAAPLEVPSKVSVVESRVDSGTDVAILVEGAATNRTVRLEEGR